MSKYKIENHIDGNFLALVVAVVIAIAIYAMMGSPISTGVTSLSNTTGHTGLNSTLTGGYSGWSSATTAAYSNSATMATLAYWLIPLVLIMFLVKRLQ